MTKIKSAFTIVEMLLSMTFISFLMLLIGMIVMHLGNIYQQGVAIRDVNKTANQVIEDMQATIAAGGDISCAIKLKANDYMTKNGNEEETCRRLFSTDPKTTDISGGVICTGRYSYLWNYGYALADSNRFPQDKLFRYNVNNNGTVRTKMIRMAKVADAGKNFCDSGSLSEKEPLIYNNNTVSLAGSELVTELIEANERELGLHSISVMSSSPDVFTNQALYEFEFVLGTFRDKLLMTNDARCKTKAQGQQNVYKSDGSVDTSEKASEVDLSYCAINKFNFAIRANKGKGIW